MGTGPAVLQYSCPARSLGVTRTPQFSGLWPLVAAACVCPRLRPHALRAPEAAVAVLHPHWPSPGPGARVQSRARSPLPPPRTHPQTTGQLPGVCRFLPPAPPWATSWKAGSLLKVCPIPSSSFSRPSPERDEPSLFWSNSLPPFPGLEEPLKPAKLIPRPFSLTALGPPCKASLGARILSHPHSDLRVGCPASSAPTVPQWVIRNLKQALCPRDAPPWGRLGSTWHMRWSPALPTTSFPCPLLHAGSLCACVMMCGGCSTHAGVLESLFKWKLALEAAG